MNEPTQADCMTVREAMHLFQVCRWTIYAMIRDGRLKAFKTGKGPGFRLRIYTESVNQLLKRGEE